MEYINNDIKKNIINTNRNIIELNKIHNLIDSNINISVNELFKDTSKEKNNICEEKNNICEEKNNIDINLSSANSDKDKLIINKKNKINSKNNDN
jgi:Na+/phosphate symporter